jgi:hypothetical protein
MHSKQYRIDRAVASIYTKGVFQTVEGWKTLNTDTAMLLAVGVFEQLSRNGSTLAGELYNELVSRSDG